MRLLQDLSVSQGTEITTSSDPGNWIDVTSDSSVQIIHLDHMDTDISLYSDETRGRGRFDCLDIHRDVNNEMILPRALTKRNKLAIDFIGQTPTLNTYNQTEDRDGDRGKYIPSLDRLSGKGWLSDSCLNNPAFKTDKKTKDFVSTGDLTCTLLSDQVKPILRKPSKRRDIVRKTVSFKESGTETRYYVKCEYTSDKDETKIDKDQNYSEFETRNDEATVAEDDSNDSDEFIKKPITTAYITKHAKVVKCPTLTRTSTLGGSCRQRISMKRKLGLYQKGNNPADSTAEQPEIDLGILPTGSGTSFELFSEPVCKIPRFSGRKRDLTDIGPLSKFLMENEETILTSTPKKLTKSCPDLFKDDVIDIQSNGPVCGNKLQCLASESGQQLRMAASNFRSTHCQRKLSFAVPVNKTNISDVNCIPKQNTIVQNPKPTRPRLGIHRKSSKLAELNNLERHVNCDWKRKLSKSNRGIRIKTNGSLKCTTGIKSDISSPTVRSFKRTVRPPHCSVKICTGALYLESRV